MVRGDGFCLGECGELYAYGMRAFLCASDASVTSHYIFIAMCTSLCKYQTSIGFLKQCLHVYEHRVRNGKHTLLTALFPPEVRVRVIAISLLFISIFFSCKEIKGEGKKKENKKERYELPKIIRNITN